MVRDEDAVRSRLAAFEAAWDAGDLTAALAMCTPDVVFIGSGEGEEATGREAVAAMVAAFVSKASHIKFSVAYDDVRVDVRGDTAFVTATGTATLESPDTARTGRYRLTSSLVRSEDSWLLKCYHGSEPISW